MTLRDNGRRSIPWDLTESIEVKKISRLRVVVMVMKLDDMVALYERREEKGFRERVDRVLEGNVDALKLQIERDTCVN